MTIEEKAEAYDEAKARMRKAWNENRCSIYFMNEIFPETKESEDERIRKTLIEYFNAYPKDYYGELKKIDILSFLKKQKPINYTDDDMRLTIIQFFEYASSYGCPDILSKEKAKTWIAWLEKQDEQKPSAKDTIDIDKMVEEWKQNTRFYSTSDILAYRQGLNDAVGKIVLKPAWSEEDEKMLNHIICDIESIKEEVVYCKTVCDEEIDWLKSLKDRMKGE